MKKTLSLWLERAPKGKLIFLLGFIGIGFLQILSSSYLPFFIPNTEIFPLWTAASWGVLIVIFALLHFMKKPLPYFGLILSIIMLLMAFCFQLPDLLNKEPFWEDIMKLGAWTSFLKLLSFSGACLWVDVQAKKYKSIGRYFFSIMLIIFGIDHFLFETFVITIFPEWFPIPAFWTKLTGAFLFLSGVCLLIDFKVREVGLLTAIMIFSWVWLIHLPLVIKSPYANNYNEIISFFQAIAFSGIALMFAQEDSKVNTQ